MSQGKEIEREIEKEIELNDPFLSGAYLIQELEVSAFLKTPSKVSFRIKGDIDKATKAIQNNMTVGVLDYISAVKRLRNQIFFLKSTSSLAEKVQ